MKRSVNFKWIVLLIVCFFSFNLAGYSSNQRDKLEIIIEKYSKSQYVESVKISPKLLGKLSGSKNTDELLKGVSGLNILSFSKKSEGGRADVNDFKREVKEAIKKGYSSLMDINSNGDRVSIYLADENAQVAMLIESDDEFSLLCIDGAITNEIIKAVVSGDIRVK